MLHIFTDKMAPLSMLEGVPSGQTGERTGRMNVGECRAVQIARDGVRDPHNALVLSLATAVAIACILAWTATLLAPSLFIA